MDGEDHIGLLLFMQSSQRNWHPSEIVVLKTLGEQVVIALNNAGLRRLVRNLSVTDEKSGLLKRASYLDLGLAEAQRAVQQAAPLTILLMHFGRSAALIKEFGEPAVEATWSRWGSFLPRISAPTISRSATTRPRWRYPGRHGRKKRPCWRSRNCVNWCPICDSRGRTNRSVHGGLAEAVMRMGYDPVDIVTEVINRAEQLCRYALALSERVMPRACLRRCG